MYNRLGQIPGSITGTLRAPAGFAPYPEVQKSQWIRLADVAIIGPAMIYSAMQTRPPAWVRSGMVIAGVATILYNLVNFLANQKQAVDIEKAAQQAAAPPSVEDLLL